MDRYDIVYILKNDIKPDELRYSLRSVEQNLPHGKIWFVGGQPNGLYPDNRIAMFQRGVLKWEKARGSLLKACRCKDITDKFWLFNDDFFVLKPVTSDEPFFGGMLHDRILHIEHRYNDKRTGYTRALRFCEQVLQDAEFSTFDYALHIPLLVDKQKMLEALKTFPDCPMFRSLYGNYASIGGTQHDDVKIAGINEHIPDDADYVSTSDVSFHSGVVGSEIRLRFPKACRYEQAVRP